MLCECRVLSLEQLDELHVAIVEFCRQDELIYGPTKTMNFHLLLHLRDLILDFGALHTVWCFAYERMNGLLGSYKNDSRAPEVTMMRHFLSELQLHNKMLKLDLTFVPSQLRGAIESCINETDASHRSLDNSELATCWLGSRSQNSQNLVLYGLKRTGVLDDKTQNILCQKLKSEYSNNTYYISPQIVIHGRLQAWGDSFGSTFDIRSVKTSNILIVIDDKIYPARIKRFIEITAVVNDSSSVDDVKLSQETLGLDNNQNKIIFEADRRVLAKQQRDVYKYAELEYFKARGHVNRTVDLETLNDPAPVVQEDLSVHTYFKNEFTLPRRCSHYRFVPLHAILTGFVQYPLPSSQDPSRSFFKIIQLPRRIYKDV